MRNLFKIAKIYFSNRSNWEDICVRCGRCCYERELDEDGNLQTDFSLPCIYLDAATHMCLVYENRFEACERCAKVGLRTVLFSKYLPSECAYVNLLRQ